MSGIKKQRHKRSRIGILMVIILAAGVYFIAGQYDGKSMDDNDSKQWEAYGAEKALTAYGKSLIGISGCGPTCLSMVAVYLLKDTSLNPKWMCQYSEKNGYYTSGQGTAWALMTDGARGIGLKSTELLLDKQRIIDQLRWGIP
ncbi:MAG: hypothetical protein RR364_09270 [Lachnospiraceae bacterium]